MYDVIIVLAGGIKDTGELPDSVIKRIEKAKELFDNKRASRVLMSGRLSIFRKDISPKTEADAMAQYAEKIGIPRKKILKEEQSSNTTTNAFYSLKLFLKPNNWKNIIVVTSDFHLPRTRYIFDKFLGAQYTVLYHAAETKPSFWQWLKWQFSEWLLLKMTQNHFDSFKDGDHTRLEKQAKTSPSFSVHPLHNFVKKLYTFK